MKQRQESAELAAQESSTLQQKDREELQERLSGLHSTLKKMEAERAELENLLARLGKDKASLRKTLEKVSLLVAERSATFRMMRSPY